jgi:hypothetical protein
VGPYELSGAVEEGEAQRLNSLEDGEDGARGGSAHRARLDLTVRQQVVKVPCLGVLEKRGRDPRRVGVGAR